MALKSNGLEDSIRRCTFAFVRDICIWSWKRTFTAVDATYKFVGENALVEIVKVFFSLFCTK